MTTPRPWALYVREADGPTRWSTYREQANARERVDQLTSKGQVAFVVDERTGEVTYAPGACTLCSELHPEGTCLL